MKDRTEPVPPGEQLFGGTASGRPFDEFQPLHSKIAHEAARRIVHGVPPDEPLEALSSRARPLHLSARESHNRAIIQFVTVCTKDRAPLLADPKVHDLLREIWSEPTDYRVGRYVLMPDHLHLFCSPGTLPPESLDRWMRFWKSRAAQRWPSRVAKVWQRDFWDRQLRVGESYHDAWTYVRNNPVRSGLAISADDWPYQGEIHVLTWHD